VALFSSTQPSIRARILPRFPAQVLAGTGMVITKSGGVYTFAAASVPASLIVGANTLTNAVNDAAAGAAGVAVGHLYRNGSVLMVRVS
jgi:hypothetical protein